MNKTAFILSLFSLAMGVSLATEERKEHNTSAAQADSSAAQADSLEAPTDSLEAQTDSSQKECEDNKDLAENPDENINMMNSPNRYNLDNENKTQTREHPDHTESEKSHELKHQGPAIESAEKETKEEHQSKTPVSGKKKKSKNKRTKKTKKHANPTTSHEILKGLDCQTSMQGDGCPSSCHPDSNAIAVVSSDPCAA